MSTGADKLRVVKEPGLLALGEHNATKLWVRHQRTVPGLLAEGHQPHATSSPSSIPWAQAGDGQGGQECPERLEHLQVLVREHEHLCWGCSCLPWFGKETARGPLGLGAEGISGGCCALVLAQCSDLLFTYTPSLLFGTKLTIKSVLKSKGEVRCQQSAHRGASQGLLLAWEII